MIRSMTLPIAWAETSFAVTSIGAELEREQTQTRVVPFRMPGPGHPAKPLVCGPRELVALLAVCLGVA